MAAATPTSRTASAPSRALRRKGARVAERLREAHGSPRHGNKDDPLDELVYILLSQMTTAPSFGRVYDRLKGAVGSWDAVLEMPLSELCALIEDGGLSKQKAPRIKEILGRLAKESRPVSLDHLRRLPDSECERFLTALPGVGLKTAKCVMMYALGREVLPVDTHVSRVARRLGLLAADVPYPRVHDALEAVVPAKDRYDFHVNAVAHGRAVCLDRYPRCRECCLRRSCPSRR